MAHVDDILSDIVRVLRPALESALARVKEDAKREAAAEFRARFAAMLDETPAVVPTPEPEADKAPIPKARAAPKGRASPGTVKPQILDVLRQSPEGISTRDIATLTGFKYNSVRGTLWLLKKEGHAANRDDKWFPASREYRADPDLADMLQ
jgi:hypothetical protein